MDDGGGNGSGKDKTVSCSNGLGELEIGSSDSRSAIRANHILFRFAPDARISLIVARICFIKQNQCAA